MKNQIPSVLFVSHDASPTGAPIFLLRYLRWLREYQPIPFQILVGRSGRLMPDFGSLGHTELFEPGATPLKRILRRLKLGATKDSKHTDALRKRLEASNIGLVYCNTIVNGRILDFLSFLNCPVICHVHELEQVIRRATDETSLRLVRRFTTSYIAVSYAVKNNLVLNHRIPEDKIRVIHGFIPTDKSRETGTPQPQRNVRQELGIPAEARVVCACGSIESRKGTDLFLEVAEKVMAGHTATPVHFIWVGGRAAQIHALQKQMKSGSQAAMIHFVGHQEEVAPYYDASDLFLLTSREDPFPLVMMEAALRRKPIVCFDDTGGAPEFVEQDAGFVVPRFDVTRMAEKVITLFSSDDLCNRMGAVARQKVLDRHDISVCAPKILSIIQETLSADENSMGKGEAVPASPNRLIPRTA